MADTPTLADKAAGMVTQKVSEVSNGVLGWFGDAFKGIALLPVNAAWGAMSAVGGLAKGIFSLSTLTTGAILSLVAGGLSLASPQLRTMVAKAIGGDALVKKLEAEIRADGGVALAKQSAIIGFGASALWNGTGGAMNAAGEQQGVGGTIGGMAGVAAMALVAIGALKKQGAASVVTGDAGGTVTPPATPVVTGSVASTPPAPPRG